MTSSLLYPEILNNDDFEEETNLSSAENQIIMIISKLINRSKLDEENPKSHNEIQLLNKIKKIIKDKYFFDAVNENYNEESLIKEVSDQIVTNSNLLLKDIQSLKDEQLNINDNKSTNILLPIQIVIYINITKNL